MYSLWHKIALGRYNPQDRWVGLDYKKLFLDPDLAKLTYVHEVTHGVLGTTTDFGQTTQIIYRSLPQMKHIPKKARNEIVGSLKDAQLFIQEGSATLMETLMHSKMIGKQNALLWAKEHLPDDYYKRLHKLLFVFDMGNRYREEFTKKIPHLSMHTGIRNKIVELDLLRNPSKLIKYLEEPQNNPDARFLKMIDVIKYKTHLPTKGVKEIAQTSGIVLYPDYSKQEIADFLNYLVDLIGKKQRKFETKDIGDTPEGQSAILKVSEETIVANMNMNFRETGMFLWKVKDLLNYSDITEVVLVNQFGDDLEYRKEMELLTGNKYEAGLVAFTKTYEKYIIGLDYATVSSLLQNEYKNKTLIVKWGLYNLGSSEVNNFPNSRKPDVVIYNTVKNLQDKFNELFSSSETVDYLHMGASEHHPFNTLLLKENGVIHLVNAYGNKHINDLITNNNSSLNKCTLQEFIDEPKHFNNALSVWMGLHWEIDWYQSMVDGKNLIFNK